MFKTLLHTCFLYYISVRILNASNNTFKTEPTRRFIYRPAIFDLVKLGRTIANTFHNLAVSDSEFLRDLITYREDLTWLRTYVIENRTEGRTVYRAIKRQRGPPFLNIELEDSQLLDAFKNWTKKEVKEVRQILYEIDLFWSHVEIYSELHESETEPPTFYRRHKI